MPLAAAAVPRQQIGLRGCSPPPPLLQRSVTGGCQQTHEPALSLPSRHKPVWLHRTGRIYNASEACSSAALAIRANLLYLAVRAFVAAP